MLIMNQSRDKYLIPTSAETESDLHGIWVAMEQYNDADTHWGEEEDDDSEVEDGLPKQWLQVRCLLPSTAVRFPMSVTDIVCNTDCSHMITLHLPGNSLTSA